MIVSEKDIHSGREYLWLDSSSSATRPPPPPLGVVMAEIEKGNAFMVITQMDLKQSEKQEQLMFGRAFETGLIQLLAETDHML